MILKPLMSALLLLVLAWPAGAEESPFGANPEWLKAHQGKEFPLPEGIEKAYGPNVLLYEATGEQGSHANLNMPQSKILRALLAPVIFVISSQSATAENQEACLQQSPFNRFPFNATFSSVMGGFRGVSVNSLSISAPTGRVSDSIKTAFGPNRLFNGFFSGSFFIVPVDVPDLPNTPDSLPSQSHSEGVSILDQMELPPTPRHQQPPLIYQTHIYATE